MDIYVRPGDTLWYYSQLFRIPLQLIVQSNRDIDVQALAVGQRLQVPGFITGTYQVRPGETLWGIAQNRGISLDAIFLVNPGIDPSRLQAGQVLRIPLRVTWQTVNGRRDYDYQTMISELDQLQQIYPFLQRQSIGNSVLGRDLPEIRIGTGPKRVHYDGSFHANEWITTPVIMTFLNDYLLALTNQTALRGRSALPLYGQSTLSIVPMVNPDGVELVLNGPPVQEPYRSRVIEWNGGSLDFSGWKANINGVDLNDQFPAEWELERDRNPQFPGPRDYGGESPLSQPEAIAMAELTRRSDFARVLPFHTQGEVIYYGFNGIVPPGTEPLLTEFSNVSGYAPIETVDSYAGYKDWFIQDWNRPGFTIELGRGTNPLPISQFDQIYEAASAIMLAGLYM